MRMQREKTVPTSPYTLLNIHNPSIVQGMESVVRYRYRAYPTLPQRQQLARTFGCARVVFNSAVAAREQAHRDGQPMPSTAALSKTLITQAKRTIERSWLAEVSPVPLQQALADAHTAYKNFFASLAGARAGRKVGHPKFRSRRDNRQAVRYTNNARYKIHTVEGKSALLRLPHVGDLALVWSRELPEAPTSVTIIKEADGRYYASFVVKVNDHPAAPSVNICGLDVGLKTFAVQLSRDTTTGLETVTDIANPRLLRRKARALARSQKSLARKQRGSKNRAKAVVKVAARHRQVREARLDHAHQVAAKIVADHQIIVVEDLAVAGLARSGAKGTRGRGNRKSVHDAGLGQFLAVLAEKSHRQGRTFIKIDRWFPSTQICFHCKATTGPRGQDQLHIRTWTCSACQVNTNDRDTNAARNILAEGLRLLLAEEADSVAEGHSETQNDCGGKVRPGPGQAPPGEAGTDATTHTRAA